MDVRKIAELAHLEITVKEIETYTPQLKEIVAYIEQLNELDTDDVEASLGGLTRESEETNAIRKDVPVESLGTEKALDQAPESVEGHFRVPKVL
jgi:aspartyl-tRNA(Asn)/glutamyl-tRNA(Gln) amidotransferase subunit C